MNILMTLFVGLAGVAMGYSSDRSPQRFAQSAEHPDYDHDLEGGTLASHESLYDDSQENYHTSDDGSPEYDSDGSPGYSQEKSNSYNSDNEPRYEGPLAQPPGYEANGQPLPVQDLPAVVAERQKHLQLFSYGAHAGSVAAAPPYLKPVPGGFSSPWVPIIVPLHHHQQKPYHQQALQYNNFQHYQG